MKNTAAVNPIYRNKKNRVWELDFLRGVAVIAMCFDHLMFDFAYCRRWFSGDKPENAFLDSAAKFAQTYWATGTVADMGFRFWAHHIFVFLFLFMVGISCAFSRDNIKRGSLLAIVSLAFSGVTFIVHAIDKTIMSGIVFGILQCIALSILCAAAVDILTKKVKWLNTYLPLILGTVILACAIIACGVSDAYPDSISSRYLSDRTFETGHMLEYILGGGHSYGDDWFGLFPNVGMVLLGMYWGKSMYSVRRSLIPALDGKWNKPITFVGRHALIFYLAHQVLITAVVGAICLMAGYRF